MKPQFGLTKTIDGSRSLRKLSLKKYKHLSNLKVVKFLNIMSNRNPVSPAPILQKLSVSAKSLDLSQYDSLEDYPTSKIKLISKRFHKVTRFSLLGNKKSTNGLLLAVNMLKKAKNLQHLSLKDVFDGSPSNQIFQLISRHNLKTIYLSPLLSVKPESTSLLSFSNYCPLRVKELSLYWKFLRIAESTSNLSLNHFENLEKLELGMPLALETLQDILKSIGDPSRFKVLRFFCVDNRSRKKPSKSDIQAFLKRCSNLEELNIQTYVNIYPDSSLSKLKKLTLESSESGGLLGSINFVKQQKESLESLCLISKSRVERPINELLEELKPMKRLKKLKLQVGFELSKANALNLAQLIEELECLEDLDVMDMHVNFSQDNFEKFCHALQKISGTLKSLKLFFNDWSFSQKHSSLLVQTLRLLSGLEHITLKNFGIEGESFFSELREIVCYKNKNLNEVFIEHIKREKTTVCCENVMNMLKGFFKKPTMKKLSYLEAVKCGFVSDFKDIEVPSLWDVLKDVHHFDHLNLSSYLCKPSFNSWNLSWHQWMER